jgi:hypothetical protein
LELRRAVSFAEIIRLHELRGGVHLADLAHREHDAAALIDKAGREGLLVAAVWIPEAIHAAETRRGKRLVYRGVGVDPRVALRDGAREIRELLGELGIHQAGVARATPVMKQTGDRPDAEFAKALQRCVHRTPVECIGDSGAISSQRIGNRSVRKPTRANSSRSLSRSRWPLRSNWRRY